MIENTASKMSKATPTQDVIRKKRNFVAHDCFKISSFSSMLEMVESRSLALFFLAAFAKEDTFVLLCMVDRLFLAFSEADF